MFIRFAFVVTTQTKSKFKFLKFNILSKYKNQNENEYIRWFKEIEIEILRCFDYFFIEKTKILWVMFSLNENSQIQWFQHINENFELTRIIFENFKQFLLNLIFDFVNRKLFVYEKFENVK